MKWVLCEHRSDEWEDIAINSDTIKNVQLITNPKFWCSRHYAEGDDKYIRGRTHDEPGDIIIETNDGKFYRFYDGGSGWEEFQDPLEFSIIIYQRLLQALGSVENGTVIIPYANDTTPAYRSSKVIVLFDYSQDIDKVVSFDGNGLGLMRVTDCYGFRLDEVAPYCEGQTIELIDGFVTLKKEVE